MSIKSFPIVILQVVLLLLAAGAPVAAQTNFMLHAFAPAKFTGGVLGVNTNIDGVNPNGWLTWASPVLYGTAVSGGANGSGTLFSINTNGAFRLLYTFPADVIAAGNAYGANPNGGLVLSNTTLFGTTFNGGTNDNGAIFSISTNGTGVTNRYSFTALDTVNGITNKDGANPSAGLVLAGTTLYGTAQNGGFGGNGTVFGFNTSSRTLTVLHQFTAMTNYNAFGVPTNSDGANPSCQLLLLGATLYGTTSAGGTNGLGTVFALNTNGTGFVVRHHFDNDGASPSAGLVFAGGNLFGIGGSAVFALGTNGLGFTVLRQFDNPVDVGATFGLNSGLTVTTNMLCGVAFSDGTYGCGQIFSLNSNGGAFTDIHDFTALPSGYPPPPQTNLDGAFPSGGLIWLNGSLYGAASQGGTNASGVLFKATPPPPFPILSGHRSGQNLLLSFQTYAGMTYIIQQNSDLATTNWLDITNIPGDGSIIQYMVPIGSVRQIFFRAILSNGTLGPPASFSLALQHSGGGLLLNFQTLAGLSYTIQQNTNLIRTNWIDFAHFTGDGSLTQWTVPVTNAAQIFFRVRQP